MNKQRLYPRMHVRVPVLCELANGEVFGGMIVATILSIFLVPVLYVIIEMIRERGLKARGKPGDFSASDLAVSAGAAFVARSTVYHATQLDKLVERISGKSLHEFSRDHVFRPLKMT